MSLQLRQLGTSFKILFKNKDAALAAIKKLPGLERNLDIEPDNHFSWVDTMPDKTSPVGFRYGFMDSKILELAFLEWNWLPVPDPNANIASLTFLGDKEGDYDLLFRQIAPWVESGSYLEFINEEGYLYRYDFDDGAMKRTIVRRLENVGKIFEECFWRGKPVKTASFQHSMDDGWRVCKARTGRKGIEFTKEEINLQTNVVQWNRDVLIFAPKDDAIYIYRVEIDDMPMLYFVGKI